MSHQRGSAGLLSSNRHRTGQPRLKRGRAAPAWRSLIAGAAPMPQSTRGKLGRLRVAFRGASIIAHAIAVEACAVGHYDTMSAAVKISRKIKREPATVRDESSKGLTPFSAVQLLPADAASAATKQYRPSCTDHKIDNESWPAGRLFC